MTTHFRKNRVFMLLLVGLVLVGAALRLLDLGAGTIGHIEVYVPNIPLPEGLSFDPPPRVTLVKSLTGPIAGEPHPPGFYAFMYFWTELFGVSKFAIRLPAALLGISTIVAIFFLGRLERDGWTAVLAAAMLTFNGLHIYWSQTARMYAFGTFFGVVATALLLWMVQHGKRQWWVGALYGGVSLAGMTMVLFYWPIFITQIIWTILVGVTRRWPVRPVLSWQLLTAVLGAPLWSIAIFQTRWRSPASFSANLFDSLGQFLQFGLLWEPKLMAPDPWGSTPDSTLAVAGIYVLLLLGVLLLVVGTKNNTEYARTATAVFDLPFWMMVIAGGGGMMGILSFTALANSRDPSMTLPVLTTLVLPPLLVGADWILRRSWSRWQTWGAARLGWLRGFDSLSTWLALLPALVVVGVGLYAPRAILLFVPYLLVVLSRGLARLLTLHRGWIALAALLFIAHVTSAIHYRQRLHHPTDYQGLATAWIPEIESTDLVFVQLHWATPSIFYYLDANQYNVIGQDYAAVAAAHPEADIWVLQFEDLPLPEEMTSALDAYERVNRIEALRIWVDQYAQAVQ